MSLVNIIAGGAILGITYLLVQRATTLRYQVYLKTGFSEDADGPSWKFRVFKGEKVVHDDERLFLSAGLAEQAAKLWISQNPNAGR